MDNYTTIRGGAIGAEFQINTGDIDSINNIGWSCAGLSDGGFAAVWQNYNPSTDDSNIYGRISLASSVSPPSTVSVCNMPEQCYDSSSEGVYNLNTQIVCSSTQVCAASNSDSSGNWPIASIITTAVLGTLAVAGWGLYLYERCKTPSSSSPDLKESNVDSAFSRDTSSQKLMNNVVATTALQVFIPLLVMNLQMQVTSAMQTIEDQASWLASWFEEKGTHVAEVSEDVSGYSYPYQEMCFDNFGFLSANDTCSSYDYCDFG